ncbi:UTP--glucose-1-phosphate uridylyltransferase GalU [Achromobacter insolitus]|uniref:UTP--glucose-1-phosphate uridylyltransferase GalU n=1 Tax=Achromobacter insolitus TaxID=217204 RepID=UPI0007C85B31|nr:UTP--glucose-1-phosphate uridylyltransferase GalU [Achromobacter insolitus]MCP1402055.1 UTP--glucose-1-phosphate uridylyltransferase [Achromobacter insolitus]OAE61708.1 UTP--glucose-1-phosphate uridylyltransferase [Achromobacter insolitus]OCZ57954.1 UTP--glucose-1-phosphate uridylyltransferase [Achromobacter insolitus]
MKRIRIAVFPVAGLGTRFLPATKAMPKEMLPVVDKPLIQYAVEEAVAAGFTELVFVTGRNKRAIEDHFDRVPELELDLESKNKVALLDCVRNVLPAHVNCFYTRQPAALGLGHAVLCAAPIVGSEPFAVLLADDMIDAPAPVIGEMTKVAREFDGSVLALQKIPRVNSAQYGIVSGSAQARGVLRLNGMVEKPAPADAPSDMAVVGRYILDARIFDCLRQTQPGVGGEIQLTDGIAALLREKKVFGYEYEGIRYDCGSKAGFYQATMEIGRKYHGLGGDQTG